LDHVALATVAARPAFTQIVGGLRPPSGHTGIAESIVVEFGGVPQRLDIRGRDVELPIVLFLHGGPGAPESPTSWIYQSAWEEFFVVVQWDQRGCGRSLPARAEDLDLAAITIDRMVEDGAEVVAYLLKRFGRHKLFVLGHSWGTVIGVGLAQRMPERLFAYIGMGQVVNSVANETESYDFALRRARAAGHEEAIRELSALAPYPPCLEDFSVQSVLVERKWVNHFGGMAHNRHDASYLESASLLSPDYTAGELARAEMAVGSILRLLPALLAFDITGVQRLDCPVFVFAGRHDHATPSSLARAWFERLDAPLKELHWFDRSAHMIQYEEPGKLLLTLVNNVLPLA
jgi:proline iminopeptidase